MARKHPATVLQKAILTLASKFEFGALLAETTPAFFLDMVAAEIDRLRFKVRKLGEHAANLNSELTTFGKVEKQSVLPDPKTQR